jgi:filamentous hemagglutinin family protein
MGGRFGRFTPRLLALAVSCALSAQASANPNGPSVVSGQATFATQGKSLTVTNTPGAVIHWQGFSIAQDEFTRFVQQSSLSAVLNRVVGGNPSEILGRLSSNGRVFLINPSGITFGAGATIDVGGLVASTLQLSDADFAAGRLRFSGTGAEGPLVNRGEIVTPAGGSVLLVAPQIENSGLIRSPSGEIVLAAGNSVRLLDASFPSIQVEVSAPADQNVSLGDLSAAGTGKVFAFLVRNSGVLSASTAVGSGGRIALKSAGKVEVAAGARIEANGPVAGSIALHAAETALVAGALEARGFVGAGGRISIEAARVIVEPTAVVAASGGSGGSIDLQASDTVLVAGALEARGASGSGGSVSIEAARVTVDPAATVVASGSSGGSIELQASDTVLIAGALEARGTAGSGGEVSVAAAQVIVAPAVVIAATGSTGGSVDLHASDTALIAGALEARGTTGSGGSVSVAAAQVIVEPLAKINVSGGSGGGEVMLVGDLASFAGAIEARAELSGDGGKVEVSGKRTLEFAGSVDTRASGGGTDGNLLIDPARITVTAGSTGLPPALGDASWTIAEDFGSRTLGALDLAALLATTSVTLQASEKITIAAGAEISVAPTAARTLALQAPEIEIQGAIRSSAAPVNLVLEAPSGRVTVSAQADLQLAGGSLRVAAPAVSIAAAQRPEPEVALARAAQPGAELARMRAEIEAELARDRERIAAAMLLACRSPATLKQGCSIQAAPRKPSFGV